MSRTRPPLRHAFRPLAAGLAAIVLSLGSAGCLQRTITVTSEPSGAVVWINDNEVGRTPVDVDFTYFGKYSVRLRREGYEPIIDERKVKAPLREMPGIDLAAEALPVNFHHRVKWHYDLSPALELANSTAEAEATVIHAGKQMRAQLQGADPEASPAN